MSSFYDEKDLEEELSRVGCPDDDLDFEYLFEYEPPGSDVAGPGQGLSDPSLFVCLCVCLFVLNSALSFFLLTWLFLAALFMCPQRFIAVYEKLKQEVHPTRLLVTVHMSLNEWEKLRNDFFCSSHFMAILNNFCDKLKPFFFFFNSRPHR